MNNKRFLSVIILVISVILIISGFILFINTDDNTSDNKPNDNINIDEDNKDNQNNQGNNNMENNISSNFTDVQLIANNLYGGEDKKVTVVEKEKEFIVTVINTKTGKVMNTFSMDKETGLFSEIAIEEEWVVN